MPAALPELVDQFLEYLEIEKTLPSLRFVITVTI